MAIFDKAKRPRFYDLVRPDRSGVYLKEEPGGAAETTTILVQVTNTAPWKTTRIENVRMSSLIHIKPRVGCEAGAFYLLEHQGERTVLGHVKEFKELTQNIDEINERQKIEQQALRALAKQRGVEAEHQLLNVSKVIDKLEKRRNDGKGYKGGYNTLTGG